jgi:hypothetical protein
MTRTIFTTDSNEEGFPSPKGGCMALNRCDDWTVLLGAKVEVRRGRAVVRIGFVDDVMADSSAIWLAYDGVQPRAMYDPGSGYEVWIDQDD